MNTANWYSFGLELPSVNNLTVPKSNSTTSPGKYSCLIKASFFFLSIFSGYNISTTVSDIIPEAKENLAQVEIGDNEIQEELKAIQLRNAMVMDKKDDEKVAKDDIVTINYSELDDNDKEIEGSKRQDFVFTVGTENNYFSTTFGREGTKADNEADFWSYAKTIKALELKD